MQVAIIGTSPIMLILANILKKNHKIDIYDEKKTDGGAWGFRKFKNFSIAKQTNVIVPNRLKEDKKNIDFLNKYLKSEFKLKIKEDLNKNYPIAYKPQKNYLYDVEKIIKTSKKYKLYKKKIKIISTDKNYVFVNNKKYDKIFIPSFVGIKYLNKNKKKIKTPHKTIVSKHIFAVFKKNIFENLSYSENFNQFFDRVQITRKRYTFFTARIRRQFKKKDPKILLVNSFKNLSNNLIFFDVMSYKNYHRDFKQENILKKAVQNSRISYVNTRQFMEGFLDLKKNFKIKLR